MNEHLALEWTTLQNNHEAYEKSALHIKLLAVALAALGLMAALEPTLLGVLLLILWFQEAILKTWQGRLSDRLRVLEQALKLGDQAQCEPFQLYSQWLAKRPGLAGLLLEYGRSAMRPTVAFPHGVLLTLLVFL
jgi:hypothetical protein